MKVFFENLGSYLDIHSSGIVCHNSDCPDVDSDLATNKRDLVKQHLVEKYGKECTASIGTIGTMGVKSTLRDLARLYEVPPEVINEVTAHEMKSYEENDNDTIDDIRSKYPGLNAILEKYPKMASAFEKLRGSITNWGTHAGGVLITDINLFDNLPVRVDKEGKIVTTWQEGIAGRELGQMGFIKFDMLAIDQLNVIEHILELIEKNTGEKINPYEIPLDDHKALDLMNKKDGLCIFQFDTELAGKVTKHMNGIKRFEDLPALSTLMRPAALQNGFDKLFGQLRESGGTVYLPDCLKEFLEDTYGLPIYQEHIMQAAIAMAGFDKVTAYKFMKLVYKGKIHTQEEKDEWRKKFVDGCQPLVEAGKVRPDFPDKFFTQILAFLGYGFCKSHAISYGLYSGVELWLKAYHPLEFMCANLSITGRSQEKKGVSLLDQRVKYCQSLGFKVFTPDVRYASDEWIVYEGGLMAPLTNLKGFGTNDFETVVKNRPYNSLSDFCEKTGLGKSKMETLILGGALDCFGDREYMYNWYSEVFLCKSKKKKKSQASFFEDDEMEDQFEIKQQFSKEDLQVAFFDLNGFSIEENLLQKYAKFLDEHKDIKTIEQVNSGKTAKHVYMFCKISRADQFTSKSGSEFMKLTLSDGTNSTDTVMQFLNYKRFKKTLEVGNVLALPIQISDKGGFYLEDLDRKNPIIMETK